MTTTTQTVSLDAFMASYFAASDDRKNAALKAAMNALNGKSPVEQTHELYLNARQIAQRYGINEATVWRWKFPAVSWGGIKRYKASDCDAYLVSDQLKKHRVDLAAKRATEKKQKKTPPLTFYKPTSDSID